jgi:hypothetical protein
MASPYETAGINAGLPPALAAYMPRYVHIESGGNPNAQTGSYTGVLQMGPDERAKYGGNGLDQGARMYADKYNWFAQKYGRDPTPTELYMVNQQGQGGLAAHMANPEGAAWRNMASTGEGQQKGDAWAKKAIWGNVPDSLKPNYPGGVDSMTSQQFMDMWKQKVEQGQPFSPVAGQQAPQPAWSPAGASQAPGAPAQGAAAAPAGGLLSGILPDAVAGMVPSAAQQQAQGGLFPSLNSLAPSIFGAPAAPGQPGQQNAGYMPPIPQPQQLQAPQINYYQPRLAGAQMPMPQLGPLRFV